MPAYFTEGFCVRTPSWHKQETLLMEDLILPRDRERAIRLAGHDYQVVEVMNGNADTKLTREQRDERIKAKQNVVFIDGDWYSFDHRSEKKGLYISQLREADNGEGKVPGPVHGNFLEVVNDSWEVIPNSVGWDVLEAIAGAGAKLETGLTLKDGALCVVTVYLDEPFQLPGDDSPVLPYIAARWAHDGSGALSTRSFMTRIVCANTDAIAENEAKRLGTDFTFRHTKNWKDRVEEAKMAIRGLRVHMEEYTEMLDELADVKVTEGQRELFVHTLIPLEISKAGALVSNRVKNNVDEARRKVFQIFDSPTIPDAHKLTGYGLRLAGIEYLDHLRGFRNQDTYIGRQLLKTEPLKAKLNNMIMECAKA